ncbi:MAG: hypothetical protein QOJ64_1309 [Acidobacteriota bacterium]|jgi:hypothetical protein|nr:hypothetical protein [Acidobacteriota bacterium]
MMVSKVIGVVRSELKRSCLTSHFRKGASGAKRRAAPAWFRFLSPAEAGPRFSAMPPGGFAAPQCGEARLTESFQFIWEAEPSKWKALVR